MENRRMDNGSGRIWMGFILLIIGSALLINHFISPLPWWIFSWKTLLIAIGIIVGAGRGFRGVGWLAMILIGVAFLIGDAYPDFSLRYIYWPVILIILGGWLIVSPKNYRRRNLPGWQDQNAGTENRYSKEDYLDSVSIFGSVKKVFLSKNFQGGDITNFMGGAELDLSQADINGVVKLDVTQLFGGTKIIVPAHWNIRSELVSIFAGIEDKRNVNAATVQPDKVLVIEGTSIFGGIEIRSF
jgi:predicted membrane protein